MHVNPVDNDTKVSRNALQGHGLETNASLYKASAIFLVMQTADGNAGTFLKPRAQSCAQKCPRHHLQVKLRWEIIGRNLIGQISTLIKLTEFLIKKRHKLTFRKYDTAS